MIFSNSKIYGKEPGYNETSIANKFCQSFGSLLNRVYTALRKNVLVSTFLPFPHVSLFTATIILSVLN